MKLQIIVLFQRKYWQEVKADIRDYEGKVWGGDIVWSSVKDINS